MYSPSVSRSHRGDSSLNVYIRDHTGNLISCYRSVAVITVIFSLKAFPLEALHLSFILFFANTQLSRIRLFPLYSLRIPRRPHRPRTRRSDSQSTRYNALAFSISTDELVDHPSLASERIIPRSAFLPFFRLSLHFPR